MALPAAYLTSVKNLEGILNAIQGAQAPDKFTQKLLESLEFKSNSDRLIIGVLKSLSFLDDGGKPTPRYFEYLDQTQSQRVLADGVHEAYADLFKVNRNAYAMENSVVVNKLKTLSEGKLGDAVAKKMASTFLGLVKYSDFAAASGTSNSEEGESAETNQNNSQNETLNIANKQASSAFGGLVYNIQIVLPESRDPAVYDAIFKSLREHLG